MLDYRRLRGGRTQQQIADACGVDISVICRLERGHRCCSPETLARICDTYTNYEPDWARIREAVDSIEYLLSYESLKYAREYLKRRGPELRRLRKQAGVNRRTLARASGTQMSTVMRAEHGIVWRTNDRGATLLLAAYAEEFRRFQDGCSQGSAQLRSERS